MRFHNRGDGDTALRPGRQNIHHHAKILMAVVEPGDQPLRRFANDGKDANAVGRKPRGATIASRIVISAEIQGARCENIRSAACRASSVVSSVRPLKESLNCAPGSNSRMSTDETAAAADI